MRFTQTGITPSTWRSEVHEHYPATAAVFAQYALDRCRGGRKPLEFASGAHGGELQVLFDQLQSAAANAARA